MRMYGRVGARTSSIKIGVALQSFRWRGMRGSRYRAPAGATLQVAGWGLTKDPIFSTQPKATDLYTDTLLVGSMTATEDAVSAVS